MDPDISAEYAKNAESSVDGGNVAQPGARSLRLS